MQDFATELVESRGLNDVDTNKSHDVARIRIVLRSHGVTLGQTEGAFLEALLNYWGTISDLSQRQEHGSQRESAETLNWEDGRRLVFQSLNVMYEVARAVGF